METERGKSKVNKTFILGLSVLSAFYLAAIFAGFLAPYPYQQQVRNEPSAPVSTLRFRDNDGNFHFRPFVYAVRLDDPLKLSYTEDTSRSYPVEFFVRDSTYSFLRLFSSDVHLFGLSAAGGQEPPRLRLLGGDDLGRDRFSRLVYAVRFSLLVAPIGTILASLLGILVGIVSGYAPRLADNVLMGAADTMLSLPTLILILAARAAFPLELPPISAAFLLIVIFTLTGWAEIARLARGLVVTVREREYVLAARSIGLTEGHILFRHILPNITGPLITQTTLMLPAFLLYEVALSFLGVGLQEPEPSLGNMLSYASDLTQLQKYPLLILSPAIVIFIYVLAVRSIGARLKSASGVSENDGRRT